MATDSCTPAVDAFLATDESFKLPSLVKLRLVTGFLYSLWKLGAPAFLSFDPASERRLELARDAFVIYA